MNRNSLLALLAVFLLVVTLHASLAFTTSSCGRFICGNDTYTGSGNLSGKTWASIQDTWARNYHNNTQGWNQSLTLVNGSTTYLWMPWYASSTTITEANLKDTYTQSLWSINATWVNNTAVTDETSETAMASVMNWSGTTLQRFINYLDVCADRTAAHMSQGPWLTSWVCTQNSGNITKNDENSASDATSRFAIALYMACQNPDLNASMRQMACDRAVNITRAALAEEWVTSCQNSTVNGSQQLCAWHLAGAGQAWGGGALTQVGQQMFFGYHESNIMANLAAYAYTHNASYSNAARNETHQFLFVNGFKNQGNTSGDFNYTSGGAAYYLSCTAGQCWTISQSGSDMDDDADSVRRWQTCNNVEYANLTYATLGESLPWEFVALQRYCQAWTTRMGPVANIADGGTSFANLTSACYRMNNGSTGLCDSTGIIGTNTYFGAGLVSNLVARQENASYFNTFAGGSLSTYSNVSNTYAGDSAFGIYNQVRYLHSIRAATGYYDFIFKNQTYNYTAYALGFPAATQSSSACTTDHAGLDWNITTATNASGSHCNIRDFILQPGVTLTITAYNGNDTTGWLKINATRNAMIYGTITGDGRGFGGGSGSGGGGGADADGGGAGGAGATSDQRGGNGTTGNAGDTVNGGSASAGGAGYNGTSAGSSASANTDPTPYINATFGMGGGGGQSGAGGAKISGLPGGGGGGGGAGGDGGAYAIIIARSTLTMNGTLNARSGQNTCMVGGDGTSAGGGNPGVGGAGAVNNLSNCANTIAGAGGNGQAAGSSLDEGTTGNPGGAGAGGMLVLAANKLNLTGSTLNVTGGGANGGTIKILYKTSVLANGSYEGESTLVYANITDAWFQDLSIAWAQNLTSFAQYWNTSIFLDVNATNTSAECAVQNYTINHTGFPMDLTTGIVNLTANISKVGNYTLLVTATDNCSTSITQEFSLNITYTPINLTLVHITPSPTGTATPLVCALTITNPDHSQVTNTTRWYRNGTLQAGLENVTSVGTGNLTIGDTWVCSAQSADAITTVGFTNSTSLVLGDSTPPVIQNFSLSPSSVTVSTESTTFTLNCTDAETIGTVYAEVNDTNGARTNFSMTLTAGLYTKTYTPSTIGNYSVIAYCTDGSQNTNTTSRLTFTAIAAQDAGSGGGGGSTTTIINQATSANYTFESRLVDGGVTFLLNHQEIPRQLEYSVRTTKLSRTCSADPPITCEVTQNGTRIAIRYVLDDFDFLGKTEAARVTATSIEGETAEILAQFRIVNLAYGVGPDLPLQLPDLFVSFPYLLKANQDGTFGGIRFLPTILLVSLLLYAGARSYRRAR